MEPLLHYISNFCNKNKHKIYIFLSRIVKIRSYSNEEKNIVKFILQYIKTNNDLFPKNLKIKLIENNILLILGSQGKKLLYDAHLDTVPATNSGWKYPPFSGKIINGKIFGRGSCDDKGAVTALVFTASCVSSLLLKYSHLFCGETIFSLSSNEENSSAKGIHQVLKYVHPDYAVICEPSKLKIVYGHKGKFVLKITFSGKPAHSSSPELGKNAIYSAYKLLKNLLEKKVSVFVPPLGKPTISVTYIESKTNSLNSIPHECSVYIDYRSVTGETQQEIMNTFLSLSQGEKVKIVPVHNLFPAWVIKKNVPFLKVVDRNYILCYNKKPEHILWNFCTNGSVICGEKKIPSIGFGPGKAEMAHRNNEFVELKQVIDSIKFYSLLPFTLGK